MKRVAAVLLAATTTLAAGTAAAVDCSSLQDAMAEFEVVKDAYVAAAPNLQPDQFQVWANYIQAFGDSMGKMDYQGACDQLAAATSELGLDGSTPADNTPTPPPLPSTTDNTPTPPPMPPTTDNTPSPSTDGATAVGEWKECPRGRCRN